MLRKKKKKIESVVQEQASDKGEGKVSWTLGRAHNATSETTLQ